MEEKAAIGADTGGNGTAEKKAACKDTVAAKKNTARKNTVQRSLARYMRMILSFLVLIVGMNIVFCIVVNHDMLRENERLLQISRFFESLSELQEDLYYQILGLQDGKDLEADAQTLFGQLEQLQEYEISAEYQRDIEDLAILMEEYRDMILSVLNGGEAFTDTVEEASTDTGGEVSTDTAEEASADITGDVSESRLLLQETQELYETMSGYFEPMWLHILKEERQTAAQRWALILFYSVLLIFTLLLFVVYMFLREKKITREITGPVHELTEKLDKMDLLSPDVSEVIPERPEYHEELNQMIDGYNRMLEKLQKQMQEHEELMDTKLLLQKQKLLNLQRQINPHFLFNTLNMISHSAYLENSRKTVELIETTANLLRYSLDYSDKEVTLQREMEAVGNYVSIQEQRFGDRIRFVFDLDESFHQMRMPSLLLQPLLENAVVHGVGMYESGGEIRICTRWERECGFGRVSIIDNGEGMDRETLLSVEKKMRQNRPEDGSIGLSNVYFRLKLFFGAQADVQINSERGRGTEVALLMPWKME